MALTGRCGVPFAVTNVRGAIEIAPIRKFGHALEGAIVQHFRPQRRGNIIEEFDEVAKELRVHPTGVKGLRLYGRGERWSFRAAGAGREGQGETEESG